MVSQPRTALSAPTAVREKRHRAFRKLNETHIPESSKASVRSVASKILRLERQLEAPTAFEQHISGSLTDAIERFEAGGLDRLCSCKNPACPLKSGRVPPRLRSRGTGVIEQADPRELAVMWLERHRGDGHALRVALGEWDSKRAEYFELIEEMHARLRLAEADAQIQRLPLPADSLAEFRSKARQNYLAGGD